jgi:trehalose synthase
LSHQVIDGVTGMIAESVDQFSSNILRILSDKEFAERLGKAGRRHVEEHFLLPRFIADELRLVGGLVGALP